MKVLSGRYQYLKELAKGDNSETWLAEDLARGQRVVVKSLSVAQVEKLKDWQLFEREARVLAELDHSLIPKFVDYLDAESSSDGRIHLVQEYIAGDSCRQQLDAGRHFTEQDVAEIGVSLCVVLEYLHGLSPPVIHRDLKSSNVVIDDAGEVHLVDFGAVSEKTILAHERRTVTLVGTFGYMPFEQFSGQVVPASDIYALGATLLCLLSNRDPDEFDQDAQGLSFDGVPMHSDLRAILKKCLKPKASDRYHSAAAVRADLLRYWQGESVSGLVRVPKALAFALALVLGVAALLYLRPGSEGTTLEPTPSSFREPARTVQSRRQRQVPSTALRELSLRLLHGEQELGHLESPRVTITDAKEGTQTQPKVRQVAGRHRIAVSDGELWLQVTAKGGIGIPGSLVSDPIRLTVDGDALIDVPVLEVMHLLAPQDNAEIARYSGSMDCDDVHAFGESPLLSWEELANVHYEYDVGLYDCETHTVTRGEFGHFITTDSSAQLVDLEPSAVGTKYVVDITAHRDGHTVGRVWLRDQAGTGQYHFRVLPNEGGLLGYVTYAGKRMDLRKDTPRFWFRDEDKGVQIRPTVFVDPSVSPNGFAIYGLPPRAGVQISFNLNTANPGAYPGDLRGFKTVEPAKVQGLYNFKVLSVVRLTSPVDNSAAVPGWHESCENKAVFPANMTVDWDPIEEADEYRVSIIRRGCSRRDARQVVNRMLKDSELRVMLPATGSTYNYELKIHAFRDGEIISQLLTHGKSGLGWDYRFRTF